MVVMCFANWYVGAPIADPIGLSGVSGLWILGKWIFYRCYIELLLINTVLLLWSF